MATDPGTSRPQVVALERSGRWVYLVALLFPACEAILALLDPFPSYGYGQWISAVLVVVCVVQFFRPTTALGLPILLFYGWRSMQAAWSEFGAFQDYGSEDHGRWEGWQTEWIFLGFTAYLIWVTVHIALDMRKSARDATQRKEFMGLTHPGMKDYQ